MNNPFIPQLIGKTVAFIYADDDLVAFTFTDGSELAVLRPPGCRGPLEVDILAGRQNKEEKILENSTSHCDRDSDDSRRSDARLNDSG